MDLVLFGGLFTTIGLLWNQIKTIFTQVRSLFIVTMSIQYDGARAAGWYLAAHARRIGIGIRQYAVYETMFKSGDRQAVPLEMLGKGGAIFILDKKPLLVSLGTSNSNGTDKSDTVDYDASSLKVSFLRGAFDPDEFMLRVAKYFHEKNTSNGENDRRFVRRVFGISEKRSRMRSDRDSNTPELAKTQSSPTMVFGATSHRIIGYSIEDIGAPKPYFGIKDMALSSDALNAVEEIKHWSASRKWYKERGIPWKRGWLLYGEAGCGKTVLSKVLSEEMNMPIFLYDLSSLSNDEMQSAWTDMISYAPCIAVMEDIDAVFDGRKTISGSLTFDCLLNCLDGVERSDGVFLIVTTNHIEKIDPALAQVTKSGAASRPGRIDRVICMAKPDINGRRKIANRILAGYSNIERVVEDGDGETGAQFQERCTRLALDYFWNKEQA